MGLSAEDLVGKHIESAHFSPDGGLYLRYDGKVFRLTAEGDCCASAYFAHVDGSDALRDAKVLRVEDLEQTSEERSDCDHVDTWGHRIITTRGTCTLDMRTEHNGYYSGWLNSPVEVVALPADCNPLRDF